MSSSRPSITQAWRCILFSRRVIGGIPFIAVPRLKEESDSHGYDKRGYVIGNGQLGSKDENVRGVETGSRDSRGSIASGYRSFESGGQSGSSRHYQSQNHGVRGRKPTRSRLRLNSKRKGFQGGFRMPDFDPGNDQLKKIFESQMDSIDPIGELDLGDAGPIEGNFRDDDDSEAEDFYKNA